MRLFVLLIFFACTSFHPTDNKPYVVVVGIAQDGGYPQIGCEKQCCRKVREGKAKRELVSCIAIVDPVSRQKWFIDATPDLPEQAKIVNENLRGDISGIFLTHAHIGHYTGLMYLGREAYNTDKIPVYAMPRMFDYLKKNGPWSQLVELNNITLQKIKADSVIRLNDRIDIQAITVPHRDEFSETVGYLIRTADKKLLYIPDIDKWTKWKNDIRYYVAYCDYLILDGTFYQDGELSGRSMAEIPHPFVQESMQVLQGFGSVEKRKVSFIHFNHTNPLIDKDSYESKSVIDKGFNLVRQGMYFTL